MSNYRLQHIDSTPRPTAQLPKAAADAVSVERPRVLMVGMHLTRTRGGITTLTGDILDSKLKNDFKFVYIASQAEDAGKVRKLLIAVGAFFRFGYECIVRRPRLVYIHVGSNASLYRESAFIVFAAALFRLAVISHFHAGDVEIYLAKQPRLGTWFIRRAMRLSSRVIAVSNVSARCLNRLEPLLNVTVIPNVINTEELQGIHRRNNGDSVRLLFVGAVGKLKGEQDLIKALARLKDLNLRVSFLGYGAEQLSEWPEFDEVSSLIDHAGPVSLEERVAYYRDADIFVLPTYAEAMPISVIEAMSAGLAVITTPVGGIPELIDDGVEGLLFEPGDVDALAQKIELLVKDKKLRLELGTKARSRVKDQMNFAKYVDDLRSEIENVKRQIK